MVKLLDNIFQLHNVKLYFIGRCKEKKKKRNPLPDLHGSEIRNIILQK